MGSLEVAPAFVGTYLYVLLGNQSYSLIVCPL